MSPFTCFQHAIGVQNLVEYGIKQTIGHGLILFDRSNPNQTLNKVVRFNTFLKQLIFFKI